MSLNVLQIGSHRGGADVENQLDEPLTSRIAGYHIADPKHGRAAEGMARLQTRFPSLPVIATAANGVHIIPTTPQNTVIVGTADSLEVTRQIIEERGGRPAVVQLAGRAPGSIGPTRVTFSLATIDEQSDRDALLFLSGLQTLTDDVPTSSRALTHAGDPLTTQMLGMLRREAAGQSVDFVRAIAGIPRRPIDSPFVLFTAGSRFPLVIVPEVADDVRVQNQQALEAIDRLGDRLREIAVAIVNTVERRITLSNVERTSTGARRVTGTNVLRRLARQVSPQAVFTD